VQFSIDHLIERLHRLLVVLEDDCEARRVELPPLAVYDVSARRWLLAAGISLEELRGRAPLEDEAAAYLIIAGPTTKRVLSLDSAELMTQFTACARVTATAAP